MSIINKQTHIVESVLNAKHSNSIDYVIRILTELQIQKLIETASKIMIQSKADILQLHHLEAAIQSLILYQFETGPILLTPSQDEFKTDKEEIEQAKKYLQKFKKSEIDARWVSINDNIPTIQKNKQIKSYHKSKETENKYQKFNIIHDKPISFFLPEEQQLYKFICHRLESGKKLSINGAWNITNLLPFVMNILMSLGPSDNKVEFLIQLLRSKGIMNSIQYSLHQVLAFLLEYQGNNAWEVGLQISRLVAIWQFKYPHFHSIFNNISKSYSWKTKRLAYETYFRLPPSIDLDKVQNDIENGNPDASRFLSLLNMCRLRFNYSKCGYHKFFKQGLTGLSSDFYLQSMI